MGRTRTFHWRTSFPSYGWRMGLMVWCCPHRPSLNCPVLCCECDFPSSFSFGESHCFLSLQAIWGVGGMAETPQLVAEGFFSKLPFLYDTAVPYFNNFTLFRIIPRVPCYDRLLCRWLLLEANSSTAIAWNWSWCSFIRSTLSSILTNLFLDWPQELAHGRGNAGVPRRAQARTFIHSHLPHAFQ